MEDSLRGPYIGLNRAILEKKSNFGRLGWNSDIKDKDSKLKDFRQIINFGGNPMI